MQSNFDRIYYIFKAGNVNKFSQTSLSWGLIISDLQVQPKIHIITNVSELIHANRKTL